MNKNQTQLTNELVSRLQVSGLLSLFHFLTWRKVMVMVNSWNVGRNKSITIPCSMQYSILVLHSLFYFNEKLIIRNILNGLSECFRAGMEHLHINVMLNDVHHKSQNNQDSNSGPWVFSGCILSLRLSSFTRPTFYCKPVPIPQNLTLWVSHLHLCLCIL